MGRDGTGRYIVVLHDGADRSAVVADYAGALKARRRYTTVFDGFAASMSAETASVLALDPRVAAVEPDGFMHRAGAQAYPTWGLDRIDQPSRNLNQTYAYRSRGRGVAVYVIDGGVYAAHRDFGDRVARGFDVTGRGARRDCDGHGTHIAGTVGGRRFGVAKKVRIVPVRVMGCSDYIRRSDVIAGFDFVARHHRGNAPAVVNISLGGPASRVADRAVNRVIDDGVTVVTAAGNQGADACATSPARVPRVITVGAVNRYDWSPNWSNYGPCVDIFAPGVSIKSTGIASPTATWRASGTSMASPHVAGVAARYLSTHRLAGPRSVQRHVRRSATSRARNTGWMTTSKLLYAPGKVPTSLDNRTSREWVDPDDLLTLRTRLRNTATGNGVRRMVVLQDRRLGATKWRRVVRTRTDTDGRAIHTYPPGGRREYRWRHPGTATTRAATSPVRRVGYHRWDATLEFLDGLEMLGRFTITENGRPMADRLVVLYSRADGTTEWTQLGTKRTDSDGRVDFNEFNVPGFEYQMRSRRTAITRAARSEIYSAS